MNQEDKVIRVSTLNKTWLFDLDGTIVKHNGHLMDGDMLLPGAKGFFERIPKDDKIIFLTSRSSEWKKSTENFLRQENIKFDAIIYGLPYGERILVNDRKISGLRTAFAVNTQRNQFMEVEFFTDKAL